MALTLERPPGSRRPPPRRRRALAVLATLLALVVAGAAVVAVVSYVSHSVLRGPACRVTLDGATYGLSAEQAANATTIAAVAKREGLPNHAVTVALAAALQESNLHNLDYGDRDSLGLFQQRPSQGWGTRTQLTTPAYAAAAFYRELARVPRWRELPVTDAAQRVQRSGAPTAYAKWEPMARVLAIATTGEQPGLLTCHYHVAKAKTAPPDVAAALTTDFGVDNVADAVQHAGPWAVASWLVGHGQSLRLSAVTAAGQRWTAGSGRWQPDSRAPTGVVPVQASPA